MAPPQIRIASLLPSLTEVVACIPSLRNSLVAVTHECDYPPEVVERCTRITTSHINPAKLTQAEIDKRVKGSLAVGHSLYGIDQDKLREADPTVVLTQALCDVCAVSYPIVVGVCARVLGDHPRVISIEPTCLSDVIASVRTVGREGGAEEEADEVARGLEAGFEKIKEAVKGLPRPKVAFLEWTDPLFNGGHWVPDLLDIAGADYTLAKTKERSIQITPETLAASDPDIILVAPCGFDSTRAHDDAQHLWQHDWWTQLRAVRDGKVYAMDGNAYYARPGPRLLQGCGIIARLIHGESVGQTLGEELAPRHWKQVQAPSAAQLQAIVDAAANGAADAIVSSA
eukprot:TRINITY_DN4518_c0_g1_i1.p1 TRINITY_DN4518_c0_g1~~TRINITY_DN4518_c0_g1_i1.p1  ORF type:complete len:359 (+),score=48.15 TRINITY_DN4518_c0_g1_i1:53-1078(+)